jgi:anti-sigma factor RsiW
VPDESITVNCQEIRELIHAYADGELDLVKNLEIDKHLQDCPACARARAGIQEVHTAIQEGSLYYPAPPELRSRIRESFPVSMTTGRARRPLGWRWPAMAASLFLCGVAGWSLAHFLTPAPREAFLEQQLVSSHIRSQMLPGHSLDVKSADQHTVRPWFEAGGKLDFSPPVPDLKAQGFDLVGGRLDYLDDRPVAVLVYQRRKHLINLFIWRTEAADSSIKTRTQQSYHLVNWTSAGLTYWAVSSVNADDLAEFARLVRNVTGQVDRAMPPRTEEPIRNTGTGTASCRASPRFRISSKFENGDAL